MSSHLNSVQHPGASGPPSSVSASGSARWLKRTTRWNINYTYSNPTSFCLSYFICAAALFSAIIKAHNKILRTGWQSALQSILNVSLHTKVAPALCTGVQSCGNRRGASSNCSNFGSMKLSKMRVLFQRNWVGQAQSPDHAFWDGRGAQTTHCASHHSSRWHEVLHVLFWS